jgi:K+-transporting ATPase A subunit
MIDTAIGFSLLVSVIITAVVYISGRDKNLNEKQQKEKTNEMIILFVVCFVVVMFGKLCTSSKTSTTLVKQTDMKGGQCPF